MESRQEFNREILKRISEYNEKYPDMRFHQILHNLGIIRIQLNSEGLRLVFDQYSEESKETLKNVNQSMH